MEQCLWLPVGSSSGVGSDAVSQTVLLPGMELVVRAAGRQAPRMWQKRASVMVLCSTRNPCLEVYNITGQNEMMQHKGKWILG